MHAMLVLLSDTLAKGPILFRHLDEMYKDILQAAASSTTSRLPI
jgi:hypothetical protein